MASMRSAINAKCRDCIHDPMAPGTWREQVAACESQDCALWPLRPQVTPPKRVKSAGTATTETVP